MLLQAVHYDFHHHSRKNMTTQKPTHKGNIYGKERDGIELMDGPQTE